MSVINQMNPRPKLIVMDTMNFWMDVALEDLLKTLKMVDVLMVNDSEARQLTGEYSIVKAAKKILDHGSQIPDHQERRARRPAFPWQSRILRTRPAAGQKYSTPPAREIPLQAAS